MISISLVTRRKVGSASMRMAQEKALAMVELLPSSQALLIKLLITYGLYNIEELFNQPFSVDFSSLIT